MRVQASGNSFPAYKREASPTDAMADKIIMRAVEA
jgi:hypothetical protein